MKTLPRFAFAVCILSLASCQTVNSFFQPLPVQNPAEETPTILPTTILTGSTPVLAARATLASPTALPSVVPNLHDEAPAHFSFPTAGPVASSGWRPPLYPVPWALSPYDHFYFIRPIAADQVNWPEPDYRYGGTYGEGNTVHSGVDIDAKRGTPILAAGPGRVIWAGYGLLRNDQDVNDPYGIAVAILHDFGYNGVRLSTVYGHMDRVDVKVGQHVEAGDQLGIVGLTGNTTGPHVHFEVRFQHGDYFTSRNPELWLVPPQGWGVLIGRMLREDNSPLYSILIYVRNKLTGQIWQVKTYGPKNVRSDDYYHENLVLSDLPAGDYEVTWKYDEKDYATDVTIHPGASSYFFFRQGDPISTEMPPTPSPDEFLFTPTPVK
jgi:murein DD-endopeptidase MepM/ murein hydrolase activator NlpD